MGAWLVLLAADRRSRCPRAALAAAGAAPSWERSCKLMARSMPIDWRAGWRGAIVDRKQKGGGQGDGGLVGPARRRPEEPLP
jgi:hypothetical protein